jgi:hypothetical protein
MSNVSYYFFSKKFGNSGDSMLIRSNYSSFDFGNSIDYIARNAENPISIKFPLSDTVQIRVYTVSKEKRDE